VSICLFLGPTLPQAEAAALCEATILPPAAQGDVWRAAQARPRAIGIVDGYFAGAPSVWHKEILWVLAQGIHVFGSASMGALRAAELHSFGMRGVGRIFEDYRDGRLEDDDEVAVVHGPAELGYPAISEPMVNIRATLARAGADGVLKPATRRRLEAFAKALHFPERNWPILLGAGKAHGVGRATLRALREWLPRGRVDQKRADALEMIGAMREALARPDPPAAPFRFERTHFWDEMTSRPDAWARGTGASDPAVLEELRLEGPEAHDRARSRALARLLAGHAVARLELSESREAMTRTLTRLRAERGLYRRAELDAWMDDNDLDSAELERLVEAETRLDAVAGAASGALDAALIDELRLSGAYPRLVRRARRKQASLAGRAGPRQSSEPMSLRLWFFQRRLGQPVPDDIAGFIRGLGFATLADFDSAVRREILYVQLTEDSDG
jgi:hypothetical protein